MTQSDRPRSTAVLTHCAKSIGNPPMGQSIGVDGSCYGSIDASVGTKLDETFRSPRKFQKPDKFLDRIIRK